MLSRDRLRRTVLVWNRRPTASWLLLAVLYLTAALLGMLLALTMFAWQPLVLAIAATVAAARCVWVGLRAGRDAGPPAAHRPLGSVALECGASSPGAPRERANATFVCTRVPM